MPCMAENAEQEVGFAKQEVGPYLRNDVVERNGRKFGPSGLLNVIHSPKLIHSPNVAEKAEEEVGSTEQEVGETLQHIIEYL